MPRLTPRRLLLIAAVLLLAATQLPLPAARRVHALPRNVVDTATAPVAAALRRVSLLVRPGDRGGIELAGDIDAQLEDYENALAYARRLEEELRVLREKLRFYEQTAEVLGARSRRLLEARVTRAITGGAGPRLVIAEGRSAGIEPGQAVVSGANLVGRVAEEVGPLTGRVELVMTPGAEVQARLRPAVTQPQTRDFRETLTVTDNAQRLTVEVWIEQPVEVGDLAHLADPLWPTDAQGFVVGQVVAIDDRVERPLEFKRVIVEPAVDPLRLRRVTVLVDRREARTGPEGGRP